MIFFYQDCPGLGGVCCLFEEFIVILKSLKLNFSKMEISQHLPKTKTISYNILNTIPYPNTPTTMVTIIIAKP